MLADQFDIKLQRSKVRFAKGRFGFDIQHPLHSVPFRIKQRKYAELNSRHDLL